MLPYYAQVLASMAPEEATYQQGQADMANMLAPPSAGQQDMAQMLAPPPDAPPAGPPPPPALDYNQVADSAGLNVSPTSSQPGPAMSREVAPPPPAPPPQEPQPLTPPKEMGENWKPAPSPGATDQFPYSLAPGAGGVVPAHEVERRGPTLRAAQGLQNAVTEGAIHDIEDRSVGAAATEYQMQRDLAAQAYAREDAAAQSAAEREQELQQRQADFDRTVSQMSRAAHDPDGGFWASRTTPQRIAALLSITLGGAIQGAHGGTNPGLDMINQEIDRAVKAQEAQFNGMRDTAQGKLNAYGLALQKYGSVDAARAAARAAALDAVQAQLGQVSALWKGTNAANAAVDMAAKLQADKTAQIANGIAYVPTAQRPITFIDKRTGLPYSLSELKQIQATAEGREFEMRKLGAEGDQKLALESAKSGASQSDQGAKFISEKMSAEGIPEARSRAEEARKALLAAPRGNVERFAPFGINEVPTLRKAVFGQEVSEREQAWDGFKAAAIKAIAGARGEGSQIVAERMKGILDSAGDQESRLAAIKQVETVLSEQERNIRGGASLAAQEKYDTQKAAAKPGGPQAITGIPGFKPVK